MALGVNQMASEAARKRKQRQEAARLSTKARLALHWMVEGEPDPEPALRALGKVLRVTMANRVGNLETACFFAAEAREIEIRSANPFEAAKAVFGGAA